MVQPSAKLHSRRASRVMKLSKQEFVIPDIDRRKYSHIPFPEWSDKEVREENWHDPNWSYSKDSNMRMQSQGHGRSHRHSHDSDYSSPELGTRFLDEHVIHLPYSINENDWKPVSEVFPSAKLEVYVNSDEYPDLITDSKHLLYSEFMRNFISSIRTMYYLGNTTKFTTQFMSPHFFPTIEDSPWRPWFHIYSNSTAGTRHDNIPTINKIGKYIVRLYWLGTWRKIYVDDRVPVDLFNNVMLPSLTNLKEAEESPVVEIWPYLLSKALLKIASLTWYKDREIVDFDIIQCLTGWMPQRINTSGLSISEIWNICWSYTNHYSYLPKVPSETEVDTNKRRSTLPMVGTKEERKEGDDDDGTEKSEKNGKEDQEFPSDNDFIKVTDKSASARYLVARCNDLRNFDEDQKIHHFSPCWSHEFLIDQTRDGPLVRSQLAEDMENWKHLRWLPWAKKKGMLSEDEVRPENFHYKIVSAFRKVADVVVYEQPSRMSFEILTLESIEARIQKINKLKKKANERRKVNPSSTKLKTYSNMNIVRKEENVRKDNKDKKDNPRTKEYIPTMPDPSFWVDYEKLTAQINTITIYFKPSRMKSRIRISDLNEEGNWSFDRSVDWTILDRPLTLEPCRNEPIYIFSESVDPQFVVINLSQTGHTEILEEEEEKRASIAVPDNITECDFCLAALIKRVKTNITKEDVKDYISIVKVESQPVIHDRSCSNIVIEEYNWSSEQLGDTVTSINTYGSKTTTLEFRPGRRILKLWIRSETSYVVYMFSHHDIVIGDLEKILTHMSSESVLFETMCDDVAVSFLKLINAFGTSEYNLCLKEFYKSYKPQGEITKVESTTLHNTFFYLLSEIVEYRMSPDEIFALRVLLLKWQREPRVDYGEPYNLCNCYDEEDLIYLKALEKYIVQIQAFCRGIFERYLMKFHDESHQYHADTLESLYGIYKAIFSPETRYNECGNLLRALFAHPNLDNVRKKYVVHRDLENVLNLKQFIHNVKLSEGQWMSICRQQFFVNSSEPIPIKINLFCDFNEYIVRVVDNDTNTEIKRYTNNVTVSEYKSNEKGYTVICYAWSPISKQVKCKLSFATKKEVQQDKITIPRISTEINSFYGMYVPNGSNIICNYSVFVRDENSLLSAHFVSSYPNAKLSFKVYNEEGKLLKEVIGKGDLVLAAITLDCVEKNKEYRLSIGGSATTLKKKTKGKRNAQMSNHRLGTVGHRGSQFNFNAFNESILSMTENSHVALARHHHHNSHDSQTDQREAHHKSRHRGSQVSDSSHGSTRSPTHHKSHHHGSHNSLDSSGSESRLHPHGSHRGLHHHGSTHSMASYSSIDVAVHGATRHRHSTQRHHGSHVGTDDRGGHEARTHQHKTRASLAARSGPKTYLKFRSIASLYSVQDLPSLQYHSAEAAPQKLHTLPYSQMDHKGKVVKKRTPKIIHPTEYNIEVSVLDDSWPLNAEEWDNLDHPMPDGHTSNFISSMKEVPCTPEKRSSLKSKQSSGSLKSVTKFATLRKKLNVPESSDQPVIEKPYWIMQTILNHGEHVDIGKNMTMEMEAREIKATWTDRDPGRAKRSQGLRSDFLADTTMLNENRACGEDFRTKRSLSKDEVSLFVLPPFDLSPFRTKKLSEVNEDDRKFKSAADLEMDNRREAALLEMAEDNWKKTRDQIDALTEQQTINLDIANKWFNGVRRQSNRMMENATVMRISVYESLTGMEFVPDVEKKSKKRSQSSRVSRISTFFFQN